MAKAVDENTLTPQPDARFRPIGGGWMPVLEAFTLVTLVVGDRKVAAGETWRALLAGRVRSARRRNLRDGVEFVELNRTFWQRVKVNAARDNNGRESIGWRPETPAGKSDIEGGYFYFWRADVTRLWSLVKHPAEPFYSNAKEWLTAQVAQMKSDRTYPQKTRGAITGLGKQLATQLAEAIDAGTCTAKILSPRSIESLLHEHGLWPPK